MREAAKRVYLSLDRVGWASGSGRTESLKAQPASVSIASEAAAGRSGQRRPEHVFHEFRGTVFLVEPTEDVLAQLR